VPVVALFGPTDVCRYYPYGVPHRVIASSARCPTCVGAHCPNIFCMKAITVEQVMENFHALLAEKVGVRS
jgi:ADP-heptose:LPS heptosyltransferase